MEEKEYIKKEIIKKIKKTNDIDDLKYIYYTIKGMKKSS